MDNIETKDIRGKMQTAGLTYLEAVKALDDGECDGIIGSTGAVYKLNSCGMLCCVVGAEPEVMLRPKIILGKWSLAGVKQKVSGMITWGRKGGLVYPMIVYPMRFETDDSNLTLQEFDDKPPMKVTLEWSE